MMTHDNRKATLYALVADLRGYCCSSECIAELLNITPRRVNQILHDLQAQWPERPYIPPLLLERCRDFSNRETKAEQPERLTA